MLGSETTRGSVGCFVVPWDIASIVQNWHINQGPFLFSNWLSFDFLVSFVRSFLFCFTALCHAVKILFGRETRSNVYRSAANLAQQTLICERQWTAPWRIGPAPFVCKTYRAEVGARQNVAKIIPGNQQQLSIFILHFPQPFQRSVYELLVAVI